jgi:predicted HTH domain antitoxin
VTKSIRLTEDEAKQLAALVEQQAASESALMRRWILRSMREARIENAVAAYQHDEVDLREGAAMAGIPIGVFVDELANRHVAILRDPSILREELEDLMATFGSSEGRAAVREEFSGTGEVTSARKRRQA